MIKIYNLKFIRFFLLFIVAVFILVSISSINAADINLNSTNSSGIGGAIDDIGSGSEIDNTLTLNPGTYNKTSDINVSINFSGKNVLIRGNGSPDQVIIDARGLGRMFNISGNSNITFENITFINGYINNGNGGSLYITAGKTTITNCIFKNNNASTVNTSASSPAYTYGGAIYNTANNLEINNSNFTNNTAYTRTYHDNWGKDSFAYGGAIYNTGFNLSVNNSEFNNNTVYSESGSGYESDNAYGYGGAIYNTGNNFNLINSSFNSNKITSDAWAGDYDYPHSDAQGAGVFNSGKGLSVTNSTFINNNITSYAGSRYDFGSNNAWGAGIYTNNEFSINGSNFFNNTIVATSWADDYSYYGGYVEYVDNGTGIDIYVNSANVGINYNRFVGNYSNKVFFANFANVSADYNWWGKNSIAGYTNLNTNNHYILNIANTTSLNGIVIGDQIIFNLLVLNTTRNNDGVEYLPYFAINGTFNGFVFNSTWNDRFKYNYTINRTNWQYVLAHLDMQDTSFQFYVMMTTNSTIVIDPINPKIDNNVTITGHLANYTNITQVNVSVDGNLYLVDVNSNGDWTLTYLTNRTGSISVLVSLTGNSYYTDFSNSTMFNVLKTTNSTIVVSPSSVNIGENVNVTGQLANYTGISSINVTIGGNTYPVTVDSTGFWSLNYTTKKTGNITVAVNFNGNDNYTGFSNTTSFEVFKNSTNSSIVVSNVHVGNDAIISGQLAGYLGDGSDSLTVTVDGNDYNVTIGADGDWSLNYTTEKTGNITVAISFDGNDNYTAFTNTTTFEVLKNSTNSSIVINPNNPNIGDNITISGQLANYTNITQVNVTIGGNNYLVDVNSTGGWILNYTVSNVGNISVSVSLSGDYYYMDFINKTNFLVNKLNSTISAEIPNGTVGETVNVTVKLDETINIIANVTIGNHTYYDIVFVDGVAIIPYSITVPYLGNLNVTFLGNNQYNSDSVLVNVNFKAPTNVIVDKKTTGKSKDVILSAKLLDHNGNPLADKTLKFYINGNYIGEAITDENGIAILKYTANTVGNLTVNVEFVGDDLYISSNSSNILKVITNHQNNTNNTNKTNTTNNTKTNHINTDKASAFMKKTGIPLIPAILAIFIVLGILLRRKQN
ncbi:MAG: Ig-like domain repeat protein [Methanobrevibacter arboriphilus]|nr:Ig-like domain repeat protein [Methanobrevibacter arboriphilus]